MSRFVYVMGCAEAGCIKIGVSSNPTKRLVTVQSSSPLQVDLVYYREFKDDARAEEVERAAHKHFADRRVRLEWFSIPAKEAQEFIEEQPEFSAAQKHEAQLSEVLSWAGSQKSLAELLGVSKAFVSLWRQSGIPAKWAVEIERVSGGRFRAAKIASPSCAKRGAA